MTLLGTIVACEAVLQLAAGVSLRVAHEMSPAHHLAFIKPDLPSVMISDPILRHRGNPDHPAHDRLGFHNETVPRHIDVVALGDSQTYGPIGKSGEAWPAVLALGACIFRGSAILLGTAEWLRRMGDQRTT